MAILRTALAVLLVFPAAGVCRAGGSAEVTITASVLSKNVCKFSSSSALSFGTLDPADGTDVTATATIDFRCMGSAPLAMFAITDDEGLHSTGPDAKRMRHATIPTEYLPYSLSLDPASGTVPKNVWRTLTISGTVRGADYRDASAGGYADTVVVSIAP